MSAPADAPAKAPPNLPAPLGRSHLALVLLRVTEYVREAEARYGHLLTTAEVELIDRDLRHLLLLLDHRGLAGRDHVWPGQ